MTHNSKLSDLSVLKISTDWFSSYDVIIIKIYFLVNDVISQVMTHQKYFWTET